MIRFNFDLSKLKKSIKSQASPEILQQLKEIADAALAELALETPVDTGKAAAGWHYEINGESVVLENDVAYVKMLNAGSSAQAPAYYIENIVLKYGKPLGPIVTYT